MITRCVGKAAAFAVLASSASLELTGKRVCRPSFRFFARYFHLGHLFEAFFFRTSVYVRFGSHQSACESLLPASDSRLVSKNIAYSACSYFRFESLPHEPSLIELHMCTVPASRESKGFGEAVTQTVIGQAEII